MQLFCSDLRGTFYCIYFIVPPCISNMLCMYILWDFKRTCTSSVKINFSCLITQWLECICCQSYRRSQDTLSDSCVLRLPVRGFLFLHIIYFLEEMSCVEEDPENIWPSVSSSSLLVKDPAEAVTAGVCRTTSLPLLFHQLLQTNTWGFSTSDWRCNLFVYCLISSRLL